MTGENTRRRLLVFLLVVSAPVGCVRSCWLCWWCSFILSGLVFPGGVAACPGCWCSRSGGGYTHGTRAVVAGVRIFTGWRFGGWCSCFAGISPERFGLVFVFLLIIMRKHAAVFVSFLIIWNKSQEAWRRLDPVGAAGVRFLLKKKNEQRKENTKTCKNFNKKC